MTDTRFPVQYMNSKAEVRDRFQVEFNKEERKLFTDMQVFIEQAKDATAIKQMAWLGWLSISNHRQFFELFKTTLYKNKTNNDRLGIDVKGELFNKFQQRIAKHGGKL